MAKISFDADQVGKIADLMEEKGLTEVEIEHGDYSIRLSRGGTSVAYAAAMPAPAAAPAAAPVAAAAAPAAEAAGGDDHSNHPGMVPSPMVGTVYMAPQPTSPDFIKVGDKVAEGATLLIIEAMKVMNPIPAPKSGTVKAILVSNEEPVEYGQPLVVIE